MGSHEHGDVHALAVVRSAHASDRLEHCAVHWQLLVLQAGWGVARQACSVVHALRHSTASLSAVRDGDCGVAEDRQDDKLLLVLTKQCRPDVHDGNRPH